MRPAPAVFIAVVAGLFFSLGCGYLAWTYSVGLFSALFEILRAQALEGALDSKALLERSRLAAWWIGVIGGAVVFWRWHRNDPRLSATSFQTASRRWLSIAIIVAGATHLGYVLIQGATVETMLLAIFCSFAAGCLFAAFFYGASSVRRWTALLAIATGGGFALLWVSVAFDRWGSQPYERLGEQRFVWVKITFPENPDARPDPESIAVEMQTATDTVKGFAVAWESENGRAVLPLRVDFSELTPDRTVIVTLPGRDPIVLKMPFARNPKPMHNYSAPLPAADGLSFRYRVT